MSDAPIRVLVAKPGLDGHDRGAKVIARALRDAGMDVIYTGIGQTPHMIVEAALQEDDDVVGLSILSGAHMTLLRKVAIQLREAGLGHCVIVAGGIIPAEDSALLMNQHGIDAIYGPGTNTDEIVAFIRATVATRRAAS